jgi:tRNA(Ile2) C34 agmatinyltransferase TiaS
MRPSSKNNGFSEADRCGKDLEGRGHRKKIKCSRCREALNVNLFSIYHQV